MSTLTANQIMPKPQIWNTFSEVPNTFSIYCTHPFRSSIIGHSRKKFCCVSFYVCVCVLFSGVHVSDWLLDRVNNLSIEPVALLETLRRTGVFVGTCPEKRTAFSLSMSKWYVQYDAMNNEIVFLSCKNIRTSDKFFQSKRITFKRKSFISLFRSELNMYDCFRWWKLSTCKKRNLFNITWRKTVILHQ